MNSYMSVSLSDLITTREWIEAAMNNDDRAKKDVLFTLGLDVNHPDGVEEEFVEHRNLQNQVVKCIRFTGVERTDKSWLRSGYATMEGHLAAASPDLRQEMINMSRRSKYAFVVNAKEGDDE